MTNTREEVKLRENARAWFIKCAQSLEEPPSCEDSYVAGYQAGSKYLPQLVAALKYAERELHNIHNWFQANHSDTDFDLDSSLADADASAYCAKHSILKALNNLPEELKQ